MTDQGRQIEALNTAFTLKFHSLAQYIAQAGAYLRPGQEAALREIEAQAVEDARESERLAEAIERLEGIPQVGPRASSVAGLNYLSLDYLLGVLVAAREKELSQYDAYVTAWGNDGAAGVEFARLRTATAAQLDRLRSCALPPLS